MTGLNRGFGWIGRVVAALVLAGGVGGFAQDVKTSLMMPPVPLLPTTAQLVEGGNAPADSALTQAILKEDGLVRQASRAVVSPIQKGAADSGWVTAYEFIDATGAYAAYTYFGAGGRKHTGSGASGYDLLLPGGERVILSGTSVVRANLKLYPESANALLKTIEIGLPKIGGPKSAAPLVPTLVPAKGMEAGSVRYALGPEGYKADGGLLPPEILGWEKAGEAVIAKYAGGGVMTLLLYPTPQIAGDRGRAIESAINADRSRYGTVKMRREGPMLILATGSFSAATEKELVDNTHLPMQVSFDKKMPLEFHAEIRKTYSLLQSIMVFCGVGAAAAIILGLFLGFGRATVRVWMGKPAAAEPEFLRIDLRGKSAAIHGDATGSGPGTGVGLG